MRPSTKSNTVTSGPVGQTKRRERMPRIVRGPRRQARGYVNIFVYIHEKGRRAPASTADRQPNSAARRCCRLAPSRRSATTNQAASFGRKSTVGVTCPCQR